MATAINRATTPPPPTAIRTPPTPRFGTFYDNYEPYTPRKSARISSQRAAAANRTPSPASAQRQQLHSPRTVKKSVKHSIASDVVSPISSPQKKRQPAQDSVRRASGSLTAEATAHAATTTLFKGKQITNTSVTRTASMLPTPSKTPQKPPNEKTATEIQEFARKLFPSDEEAMPSPKKRRAKKYTGISLDSFKAVEAEESIPIFTDSQDRVPVRDESESNPFHGNALPPPESTRRRKKAKYVNIHGVGLVTTEEAARRDDGMLQNFRGRPVFRLFSELRGDDVADAETRGAIRPRVLFPAPEKRLSQKAKKTQAMVEAEEALTDVEEDDLDEAKPVSAPKTPTKAGGERAKTPEAPKFSLASPPDTRRTTRSTNKLAGEDKPAKVSTRRSPFDFWQRTKEHKASTSKRQGDELASVPAKRTRN